jgi:hypothetical protein
LKQKVLESDATSATVVLQVAGVQLHATLLNSSSTAFSSGEGTLVLADDLKLLHSHGVEPSTLVPIAFTWLGPNGNLVLTDEVQRLRNHEPPYAAVVIVTDPAKSQSVQNVPGELLSKLSKLGAAVVASDHTPPPSFVCSPENMGAVLSFARKHCKVTFEVQVSQHQFASVDSRPNSKL